MTTKPIVKAFHVREDDMLGLFMSLKDTACHTLAFEGSEKSLHDGIVITVTLATHTYANAVGTHEVLILLTAILTPTIRMMKQTALRMTTPQSHLQCVLDEFAVQDGGHCPSYAGGVPIQERAVSRLWVAFPHETLM